MNYMKYLKRCVTTTFAFSALVVSATAHAEDRSTEYEQTEAVQMVSTPYLGAMQCTANLVQDLDLRIGVTTIADRTGRINFAEGGAGNFSTQGAQDMFYSSFARMGVRLYDLSSEYRQSVDWAASKGVGGYLDQPHLVITGSITSLDFLPGTASGFGILGIGVSRRAYAAVGRMDVRMTTGLGHPSEHAGMVVATAPVTKTFYAVETSGGIGRFLGLGGSVGSTYGFFDITKGERDPMQLLTGWMTDYAAASMLLTTVERQAAMDPAQTELAEQATTCRAMLDSVM